MFFLEPNTDQVVQREMRMYILLPSVDINYPVAFTYIPLVDYVQNLQTSDHNANIKGFMHGFASKYFKDNVEI